MRAAFMSDTGLAVYWEDMTFGAHTQLGDPGAC